MMNRLQKQIKENMARIATGLGKTGIPKCPDKIEPPAPPNEAGHYTGDRWDQALSRLHRTGLI